MQLDNVMIQDDTCSVESNEEGEEDDDFDSATPLRTFMR